MTEAVQLREEGRLKFTVDAELLRELGERLIGAPYIALGELVKNSYDADSNEVTIDFDMAKDRIVVKDKGNGMTKQEFDSFWMRVGSRQKERARVSERYHRLMTGSKGVGRLSVQYLANHLVLTTVSYKNLKERLTATVKWEEAVSAGDLTEATVEYKLEESVGFDQGTTIILSSLRQTWGEQEIEGLAEQVWVLTPPFRASTFDETDLRSKFDIVFRTQSTTYKSIFESKIRAVLDIWEAKLVGSNNRGNAILSLQFKDEPRPIVKRYEIPSCVLEDGDFEIRVFKLSGRLPGGIKVGQARDYFSRFGGVHVYDSGFHLPYYGQPENDWLRVEFDHSHRLTLSQLLPEELQGSMTFLPTVSRLYGVVNTNTSQEKDLRVQITRDRFQNNNAYKNLVYFVRWAVDFYASEVARREAAELERGAEAMNLKTVDLRQAIKRFKEKIPDPVYEDLEKTVSRAAERFETEAETVARQASTLGPLATAGIATVAARHEIRRQFTTVEDFIARLRKIRTKDPQSEKELKSLEIDLAAFFDRIKRLDSLFSYFAEEDLKERRRLPAKKTIDAIVGQLSILLRGIRIDTDSVDPNLLLPRATFAEWSSIFQNIMLNAYNAMLDSPRKVIGVSTRRQSRGWEVLVQDTGVGVNLKDSERLFRPFERGIEIPDDLKAIGYGGTGLGLTIVRLIARRNNCKVGFVSPDDRYATAFSLGWEESS